MRRRLAVALLCVGAAACAQAKSRPKAPPHASEKSTKGKMDACTRTIGPSEGELVAREVVFTGNRSDGFGGGALLVSKGSALLERCRVADNIGTSGGALIADYIGRLTVKDTLVVGNRGRSSTIWAHEVAE